MSNRLAGDTPLFVCESPVDCMSHFALAWREHPAYAATSGAVTPRQVEHIAQACEEMTLEVILSFDADFAGKRYDKLVAERLEEKGVTLSPLGNALCRKTRSDRTGTCSCLCR